MEVISSTGKSLIAFVESYRKFTHIPTPQPSLFYVNKFAERLTRLARHHNNYPNITIRIDVEPEDLIVYADENLIKRSGTSKKTALSCSRRIATPTRPLS